MENENDIWYDCFVGILSEKYPEKMQLVQKLMNLLSLERESIYRRLRKEVKFTAYEIAKIASAWNISLDKIIGITSEDIPFLMRPTNFMELSEREIEEMQGKVNFFNSIAPSSDAEYMEICNKLPRSLADGFESLYRFDIFKWAYQYTPGDVNFSFSQIILQERTHQIMADYYKAIKKMPNVSYVWDQGMFESLIDDKYVF